MFKGLRKVRTVVLGVLMLLNLALVLLSGAFTPFDGYLNMRAFTFAAALATLLSSVILLFVDMLCASLFRCKIKVEVWWLSILGLLWIIVIALTYRFNPRFMRLYQCYGYEYCQIIQARLALNIINATLIIAYGITLFFVGCKASKRGQKVWKLSVNEISAISFPRTSTADHDPDAPPTSIYPTGVAIGHMHSEHYERSAPRHVAATIPISCTRQRGCFIGSTCWQRINISHSSSARGSCHDCGASSSTARC